MCRSCRYAGDHGLCELALSLGYKLGIKISKNKRHPKCPKKGKKIYENHV